MTNDDEIPSHPLSPLQAKERYEKQHARDWMRARTALTMAINTCLTTAPPAHLRTNAENDMRVFGWVISLKETVDDIEHTARWQALKEVITLFRSKGWTINHDPRRTHPWEIEIISTWVPEGA